MHRKARAIAGPAALLGLTLAGLALAGLMLAGCSGTRPAPTAGPETFRGSTTNLADMDSSTDVVAVTASGLLAGHGSISLAGSATTSVIRLAGGTVTMTRARGSSHHAISKACTVTFWAQGSYRISGGTGRYKHASGHGTATITFTGDVPKKKDGSCDTATDDVTGATETFTATGPMSLR